MRKTKKGLLFVRSILVALVAVLMLGTYPVSVLADDSPFGEGAPISTLIGFNPDTGEMQMRLSVFFQILFHKNNNYTYNIPLFQITCDVTQKFENSFFLARLQKHEM